MKCEWSSVKTLQLHWLLSLVASFFVSCYVEIWGRRAPVFRSEKQQQHSNMLCNWACPDPLKCRMALFQWCLMKPIGLFSKQWPWVDLLQVNNCVDVTMKLHQQKCSEMLLLDIEIVKLNMCPFSFHQSEKSQFCGSKTAQNVRKLTNAWRTFICFFSPVVSLY